MAETDTTPARLDELERRLRNINVLVDAQHRPHWLHETVALAADAIAALRQEREADRAELDAHRNALPLQMARLEKKLAESRAEAAEAERDKLREFKTLFEECQEARDSVGFLGTVPDCIHHLAAAEVERDALRKQRDGLRNTVARRYIERDKLRAEAVEVVEAFSEVDCEGVEDLSDDTPVIVHCGRSTIYALTLGDFRRARAFLQQHAPTSEPVQGPFVDDLPGGKG